ncbi:Uu.00g123780.m01.CDS01 [Anthostomella pinea]|uniref:Uu.00g123780.m01.CDS01 n=1 Tax=Anthostomella pinea TaxID=933095 RepID=A0AAI8VHD0_9PEZI|nr:Uu.00g123780.m01.CDS01 [Anthostomella pinea]
MSRPVSMHQDLSRAVYVHQDFYPVTTKEHSRKTTHPCGATGISACEVLVPKNLLIQYSSAYSKTPGSSLSLPRVRDEKWESSGCERGELASPTLS